MDGGLIERVAGLADECRLERAVANRYTPALDPAQHLARANISRPIASPT